jgi:diguanylate cyclase (GGDEF)-like protein
MSVDCEILESALENASLGVLCMSADGKVNWINQALAVFLGIEKNELLNQGSDSIERPDLKMLFERQEAIYIPALQRREERWLLCEFVEDGKGGMIHYFRDVSEAHKLENQVERLTTMLDEHSTGDSLTGLLNRRGMVQRLEPQLARCRRYGTPLSIIKIGVHTGAKGNGAWHELQEPVLQQVAQLLRDYVRWADMVARDDDGEFIMVLPETPLEGARELATRVHKVLTDLDISDKSDSQIIANMGATQWQKKR